MKGTYILSIKLNKSQYIPIGKLGPLYFAKGFYTYVGSVLNGIEVRVNRHFSRNKKNGG